MTFVRAKEIPPGSGNWYDYEVITTHIKGHVRQKVIQYLGKSGTSHRPLIGSLDSPVQAQPKVACKFCDSQNTRKFGKYKDVQNYFCNDCKTKFTGTDALSHGRVSPPYIANALTEFYSGMSFHEIEHNIENQTDDQISHTAVIKWVNKFTAEGIRQTKDLHPRVGDTWIADETYLKTDVKTRNPKGVVFWDMIDSRTRFLLATIVTTTRNKQVARKLMELAAKRAAKTPKIVIADKLGAYIDGIELAYGSDTKHRRGGPFELENNTALIERFHNSLKDRTRVMRDLKGKNTLKRFTDGWLVYYNFFRPHRALKNQPPAVAAGLDYESRNWADVVGIRKAPIIQTLEPKPLVESA